MKKASGSSFAFARRRSRPVLSERKQPVQTRARATVDAILQATVQILLRPALGSLTTTRVAKVAGVSVGTLYQYFPNVEALLAAVITRYLEAIRDAALDGLERSRGLEPDAALREMLQSLLAHKRRTQQASRALKAWAATVDGARLKRQVFAPLAEALAELLATKFGAGRDAPRRALLLMGAVDGALSASLDAGAEAFDHPALADTLVQVALVVARRREVAS
jgi:AcrR family transcriptional regulator